VDVDVEVVREELKCLPCEFLAKIRAQAIKKFQGREKQELLS
jgi:hypothetical protein